MTAPAYPVDDMRTVVLNSAGTGRVTLGPRRAGDSWRCRSVAVSCEVVNMVPVAAVYLGSEAESSLLGRTFTGNQDATDLALTLYSGQLLTVVWTGGDSGVIAKATLFGTRHVGD